MRKVLPQNRNAERYSECWMYMRLASSGGHSVVNGFEIQNDTVFMPLAADSTKQLLTAGSGTSS